MVERIADTASSKDESAERRDPASIIAFPLEVPRDHRHKPIARLLVTRPDGSQVLVRTQGKRYSVTHLPTSTSIED